MKNLNVNTYKAAIDELLNKAGREWGLEDDSTIELYAMSERGESYDAMKKFYDLTNEAMAEDFGFDF